MAGPWLRIILDGMKADTLGSVRGLTERHRVGTATEEEIATYIRRAIAEFETPDERTVAGYARTAYRRYERLQDDRPGEAMSELANDLRDTVAGYLGK